MTIDEIKRDYADYSINHSSDYEGRGARLWKWSRALIESGENDEAWRKTLDAFYFSFLDSQSYTGFEVFSFRSFDVNGYALDDVKNGTMSFVHPAMFNDPFDTMLFPWLKNRIEKSGGDNVKRELAYMMLRRADALKVRCFVRTTSLVSKDGSEPLKEQDIEQVHPLMWAHYADSHKGFCIKYELTDDFVTQDDNEHRFLTVHEVLYKEKIDLTEDLKFRDALLTKASYWKYENEVRAIMFAPEKKGMVYISKKSPRISAVYLGLRCSTENCQKMVQALRETNIPLYQMHFDPKDACRMLAGRIG